MCVRLGSFAMERIPGMLPQPEARVQQVSRARRAASGRPLPMHEQPSWHREPSVRSPWLSSRLVRLLARLTTGAAVRPAVLGVAIALTLLWWWSLSFTVSSSDDEPTGSESPLSYRQARAPPVRTASGDLVQVVDGLAASLSLLPGPHARRVRRVLLVSYDVAGPNLNGGIGTANTNLARLLAREHNVTLLHAGVVTVSAGSPLTFIEWQQLFHRDYSVELIALPSAPRHQYANEEFEAVQSYEVMLWLVDQAHRFDVVHFHEWRGLAYYTFLAARAAHPALRHLVLVTMCHATTLWTAIGSGSRLPSSLLELEIDLMERQTVRHSQYLISASSHMFRWMSQHQFTFPALLKVAGGAVAANLVRMPNWLLSHAQTELPPERAASVSVQEFVFFGRLEHRKGLDIFLDAVELLQRSLALQHSSRPPPRFSLMGKVPLSMDDELMRRVQEVARRPHWRLMTNFSVAEASAYLLEAGAGRLAVMPSRLDNSPCAVQEALINGLPFLAAAVGGVAELIAIADRARATFKPTAEALATRMQKLLSASFRPAALAFDAQQNAQDWLDWHSRVPPPFHPESSGVEPAPLVSVLLAISCRDTRESEALLLLTLASIRAQQYPLLEAIVMDDCLSEDVLSHQQSESVIAWIRNVTRWQVVKASSPGAGGSAALNEAASLASGAFLLFMDEYSLAKPHQAATFIRAIQHSRSELVLSLSDILTNGSEAQELNAPKRVLALELSRSLLFTRTAADLNFLIRRETFRDLGGFAAADGLRAETAAAFLAKAVMSGVDIQLVPEALYWHPGTSITVSTSTSQHSTELAVSHAFLDDLPHELALGLLVARREITWSPPSAAAEAAVSLASSIADFGVKQGYRQWHYSWQRGSAPAVPFANVTRFGAADQWSSDGLPAHCVVRASSQHPCVVDGEPVAVMRSWRSDMDAKILITGRASKWSGHDCGDGTTVFVQWRDVTLLELLVQAGSSVALPSIDLDVLYGDSLHVGAHPGTNLSDSCDEVGVSVRLQLL